MNSSLLDRLTSRRVSVALMAFVVGASVLGVLIPQRSNSTIAEYDAWAEQSPALVSTLELLQLDRIFSSWWFVAVLALFAMSLTMATWRMLSLAWRRYLDSGVVPHTQVPHLTAEEVSRNARAAGYREVSGGGERRRFAKRRLGWWGSALMHTGMVLAILAALYSAAVDAQAVMDLSVGETHEPGEAYLYEESSLLGGPVDPGVSIRLDSLDAEYWPNGKTRFIDATISTLEPGGVWATHDFAANHPLDLHGYTIYITGGEYGEAAFVELFGEGLPDSAVRFQFTELAEGDVGYTDFQPGGWPNVEARLDPSGVRDDKPLALRVRTSDETTHSVLLDVGQTGTFGPFAATYVAEGKWARLIMVRPAAIDLIFLGFAIIGVGSLMLYLWVPREFTIIEDGDGLRYGWRAARMPKAYMEELDTILGREED